MAYKIPCLPYASFKEKSWVFSKLTILKATFDIYKNSEVIPSILEIFNSVRRKGMLGESGKAPLLPRDSELPRASLNPSEQRKKHF